MAVYGPADELLGYGLYNPRSEIAVRMLFPGADLPDDARWQERLEQAVGLRRGLLRLDEACDAYRLVHAEADGLPGLVVDRLGDVLSAEVYTLGMYQRAEAILARLAALCGTRHVLVRPSPQFLSQEGCEPPEIASPDLPEQVTVREHGTRFRVRFAGGHKTGFFCDQRENRRRLADFCPGPDRLGPVLLHGRIRRPGDAAGTGGGGDRRRSRRGAVAACPRKRPSQPGPRPLRPGRCLHVHAGDARLGRQYDVVVLDPPKLVRSRAELEDGTRKHFDLNRLAMRLVRPGGLMLSCCCSGLLKEPDFLSLLCSAAYQAGPLVSPATAEASERHAAAADADSRPHRHAADHPVASSVPESEYLKAVWMRLG